MNTEVLTIIFILSLVTFAFGFLGHYLARIRSGRGFAAIGAVWVAFSVAMLVGMDKAPGWDGLAYLFALLGVSAPSAVGLIGGGAIGYFRGDKTANA
ncbi:hypothetical protein [Yoonia sp. SS1-5]|uniref:Uncharacterized protein n=1 Tax=Yoonia rhodophyticola TaxID=3137370 RepID=A0AAN0MCE1_9RHOB